MIISVTRQLESRRITRYRGFVAREEVLQALPMEFAMEAQSLVAISLEGSVG